MDEQYVIIYSGGMDSTVLLYEYKDKIKLAISFNYGSKHNDIEYEHAKRNTTKLGIEHIRIPLMFINDYFKSDLLQSGGEIPEGHYEDWNMKKTVVPFRNGIMLSIAAGIADSRGYKKVLIANHKGDFTVYNDCRYEFIHNMSEAIKIGTDNDIEIFAPYTHLLKREIALKGKELGVDFNDTWSCYKGENVACGKCIAENTRILMADYTTKNIQDIQEGDVILSYSKKNRHIIPNKVLKKHDNGVQDVSSHSFGDICIKTTDDHKIARVDSDKSIRYAPISRFKKLKYNKCVYIPVWDAINNSIDHKAFWTGWISGVIDGDGSIIVPKKYPNEASIIIPVDSTVFTLLIKDVISNWFNIDVNIGVHRSNSIIKLNSCMNKVSCTTTKNTQLILKQIDNYSNNVDFWKGWIRGIIDTDGSIDKGSYRIYQSKLKTIEKIKKCLDIINVHYTHHIIPKEKVNSRESNKIKSNLDSHVFVLSNIQLVNIQTGNIKTFKYKTTQFTLKQFNDIAYSKSLHIGKLNTYDLTTELGNYFADGILVHNCGTCVERKEALEGFDPTKYQQ